MLWQKQHKVSKVKGDILAPHFCTKTCAYGQANPYFHPYPFGSSMVSYSNAEYHYSFGFQNQERVDEISRTGNHYTAEYWEMDSRHARRWNIDPIVKHHESPYAILANNPIWFIDPLGADTGDVMVSFGGGDFMGTGDQGEAAPTVANIVKTNNFDQKGGEAKSFSSDFNGVSPSSKEDLSTATQSAYDFVLANYDAEKGGKIALYGYSMGGVMATHLAERLGEAGHTVDILVTVDAAAAWKTSEVNRTIPSNVKVNVNYFQTTKSSVGSYGAANTAADPNKTKIYNFDVTNLKLGGTKIKHSNIDDFSIGWTSSEILNIISGAYKYQTNTRHKPEPRKKQN